MVRDINGLGGLINTHTHTGNSGKQTADSASVPADPGQGPANDVQLSNEARTLQALADQVNDLPEVNIERAEQIRAALENGHYQINDLVVADKILNAEALLGK